MDETTLWWLVTGALVATELLTGTFYLLMLAIGAAAAALAAHAEWGLNSQLVTAAVVGGLAVVLWRFVRQRSPAVAPASNLDQHLDVGETVEVLAWDAQGLAQVKHRGAIWTAVPAQPYASLQPGLHRIQGVTGNRLVLEKI